jgi:predicted  nucleic acid-binding Zn-ribbon protein
MRLMKMLIVPVVAMVVLCGVASPAQAQGGANADTALRQEVEAMRRSINELVALFKQFMDETSRRDQVANLIRRIDLAERQASQMEAELRTLRGQLDTNEKSVAQARSIQESTRYMQTLDKAGTATDVLNAEVSRAITEEQKAQAAFDVTNQRISQLESEIAAKRASIRDLEGQLAKTGVGRD